MADTSETCLVVTPNRDKLLFLHSRAQANMQEPADSTATAVTPYLVSEYERIFYYHGISLDPPELLYRSDLLENPFPLPKGRFTSTPTKTIHGVFNTKLNKVWHDVAPQICKLLKARSILYSAVMVARFFTHGEDSKGSLGPIVIWIATHPDTTTAQNAHDASPDIISLLEKFGVEGAVIEWCEGSVKTLAGPPPLPDAIPPPLPDAIPPLLPVTLETDPTHYVRRFLTAALGMPITTKEREDDDAQGSVAFFFHENKNEHNEPSARVLGVSNRHVLRKTNKKDYQFVEGTDTPQLVRVNGERRFQRGVDETRALISHLIFDAKLLEREIAELQLQLTGNNQDEAEKAEVAVPVQQAKLAQIKQHIGLLEAFDKEVIAQWSNIEHRNIGHVDWAPTISLDSQGTRYTLDVGTFELDEAKFKPNFKGNVIDLGAFCFIFYIITSSDKKYF